MSSRILLAACAMLAACSSSPPEELPPPPLPQRAGVDPLVAARAEGVQYEASGENFVLRFYADRITLAVGGAEPEIFARPAPRYPRWHGEIYETGSESRRLEIYVRRSRRCPTEAGGHVVEIRVDETELTGCGRDL